MLKAVVSGKFPISGCKVYVRNTNGFSFTDKYYPKHKNIPLQQLQCNFPPPLAKEIKKINTLQTTEN